MAELHYVTASGEQASYKDSKRALWSLSFLWAAFPMLGVALHASTGIEWLLLFPMVFSYGVGPFIDWAMGEDTDNPPEAVVPQLDSDRYYRFLTYGAVPIHFVSLIVCAWWAVAGGLHWWGFLILAITTGIGSGLGINTGHELGHKKSGLEHWLAKIVLAVPAYGHFWVEHNKGHHRDVATPEDPASSRMGESIYRFALREIPGAARRGWNVEKQRLARKGLSVWNRQNEILQSYAITAVLQLGLIAAFGLIMIPFLLIHNVFAWWQLTTANYIEHYGLLREKLPSGRYERCQPHHSWNSNHRFSNLQLFHLERHSDHHAHPTRRYQSLRDFNDVPRLPNGYYGMYTLAYVPPLWFKVMDKRVLALSHIDGDLDKVNVAPHCRDEIYARYGQNGKLGADEPKPLVA